jgi:hypothetical protein
MMPLTGMALARQQHRASPLEVALARSAADDRRAAREAAASAPDPDERAAGFVARGYTPGLLGQLAQRLGDTMAAIEAETEKIERGKRRQERIHRDHAAGRITAFDVARMQDFDEGDPDEVKRLQRHADSLRAQIAETQAMIAPPQPREMDGVEAAATTAATGDGGGGGAPRRRPGGGGGCAAARPERRTFYASRGGLPFGGAGDGAEDGGSQDRTRCRTAAAAERCRSGAPAPGP